MRSMLLSALAVLAFTLTGCESKAPNAPANQASLHERAQAGIRDMTARDPKIQDVVNGAYAYAIFPDVGKAAVGVGGASGDGVVYRNGQIVGTAKLDQASVGLDLGGATYSELVVFKDEDAYNRLINGKLSFGAEASATLIKGGAAAEAPFNHGVAVYVMPKGGLEAGGSIDGQKFTYYANNSGT